MAHYLAKHYSPKPSWHDLSDNERQQFFADIDADLSALGVESLAISTVDQTKPQSGPQTFFVVWRCPDEATRRGLISGIAHSGWHDYFETICAGETSDLTSHLARLRGALQR